MKVIQGLVKTAPKQLKTIAPALIVTAQPVAGQRLLEHLLSGLASIRSLRRPHAT